MLSKRIVDVEVRKEGPDAESALPVYVFCCDSLHVYASAFDYEAAKNSFDDQVVHFFYSYRNARSEDLAEGAQVIQERYRAHFEEMAPAAR